MRFKSLVLAVPLYLLLLGVIAPSRAATIVQHIPNLIESLGDFTPFDIDALPFNPATGVLQGVKVELIGAYTPKTANDLGPFPATTTLTTRLFVFPTNGGATQNVILGAQPNVPVVFSDNSAGIATGAIEDVDRIFNFSDLASFETGIAGPQLLVEYGFRTSNTLSAAGGASDLTSFSGSAILTYTYDVAEAVPEPATLLLCALGLAGLAWSRRKSL